MIDNRTPDGLDLTTHVIHLAEDLGLTPCTVAAGFWHEREQTALASGRLLSVFSYETTWDYQERHPTGDELVYVLDGEADLLIDLGEGERAQHLVRGGAGIVPAGGWHRLALEAPATLLFITPVPAVTEHRARRAG